MGAANSNCGNSPASIGRNTTLLFSFPTSDNGLPGALIAHALSLTQMISTHFINWCLTQVKIQVNVRSRVLATTLDLRRHMCERNCDRFKTMKS